jgi:hypothetical protein
MPASPPATSPDPLANLHIGLLEAYDQGTNPGLLNHIRDCGDHVRCLAGARSGSDNDQLRWLPASENSILCRHARRQTGCTATPRHLVNPVTDQLGNFGSGLLGVVKRVLADGEDQGFSPRHHVVGCASWMFSEFNDLSPGEAELSKESIAFDRVRIVRNARADRIPFPHFEQYETRIARAAQVVTALAAAQLSQD